MLITRILKLNLPCHCFVELERGGKVIFAASGVVVVAVVSGGGGCDG